MDKEEQTQAAEHMKDKQRNCDFCKAFAQEKAIPSRP